MKKRLYNRTFFCFIFILVFACFFLGAYYHSGQAGQALLFDAIYARGFVETCAQNLVAAIYLDYRLFDTLLEALLLLVSVIGVKQFSQLSSHEKKHQNRNTKPTTHEDDTSAIMKGSLSPIYFLIAIFGIYIIVTGMDSAGGGFQGGAILVAIVICAHFVQGTALLNIKIATYIEKVAYVFILLLGMIFLAYTSDFTTLQQRAYLVVINILIAIKVFSGLSLIYMYFMSSEMDEGVELVAEEGEEGGSDGL